MNKGIFQSGSVGKCEKQSDIFHHIRYANSPRAVVPQKTAENLKVAFSLEESEKAKSQLFQKLAKEGLEGAATGVKKIAKGIKSVLFFLFCVPYLTLTKFLSRVFFRWMVRPFSRLRRAIRLLFHTCGSFLSRIKGVLTERQKNAKVQKKVSLLSVFLPIQSIGNRFLEGVDALVDRVRSLVHPLNRLSAFLSSPPKEKIKPIEVPQEVVLDAIEFEKELLKRKKSKNKFQLWAKWTFPSVKLPRIQFPKLFKFPAFRWSPQPYVKQLKKYFQYATELKIKIQENVDPRKIDKKIREMARISLKKILEFLEGVDEKLSGWQKKSPKRSEKAANWVSSRVPRKVQSSLQFKSAKAQEHLRRVKMFSGRMKEKTESRVRAAVELVSAPVVRSTKTVRRITLSVEETFHRWSFLAVVVFELSMLLLKEAIYEFEQRFSLE